MKKIILSIICLCCCLLYTSAFAGDNFIDVKTVFNAQPITSSITSNSINLRTLSPDGYFSVYIYVNDTDADVDVYYQISYDDVNFYRPLDSYGDRVDLIFDDFAEDDGVNSDGKEIKAFKPVIAPYIRFVAREGSLTNDVTAFTLKLCVQ